MYKYWLGITSFTGNLINKRKRRTWNEIKNSVKTHFDIYTELNRGYLVYSKTKDKLFDWIQRPDVFVASGKGDCDDFANFSYELLRYIGYKAYLVGIWETAKKGHAISVFEYGGYWYYFSNENLVGRFENRNEAIFDFYKDKTFRYEIIK